MTVAWFLSISRERVEKLYLVPYLTISSFRNGLLTLELGEVPEHAPHEDLGDLGVYPILGPFVTVPPSAPSSM